MSERLCLPARLNCTLSTTSVLLLFRQRHDYLWLALFTNLLLRRPICSCIVRLAGCLNELKEAVGEGLRLVALHHMRSTSQCETLCVGDMVGAPVVFLTGDERIRKCPFDEQGGATNRREEALCYLVREGICPRVTWRGSCLKR